MPGRTWLRSARPRRSLWPRRESIAGQPPHFVVTAPLAAWHAVLHHRAERFTGAHRRQQASRNVIRGERQHAVEVGRRFVPGHPEHREYARVVLVAGQKHPGRPARRGTDEGQHLRQRPGRDSQPLADIDRVHDDAVLGRPAISEALEKGGRMGTAAHGVDDQVGRQLLGASPSRLFTRIPITRVRSAFEISSAASWAS